MSYLGGGQFDDAEDDLMEERMVQEELRAARAASTAGLTSGASRLAASRALAFGTPGPPTSTEAAYLAMLGDQVAATPYYQRQQTYRPYGLGNAPPSSATSAYNSLSSPSDSIYGAPSSSQYGYPPSSASPAEQQQRYAAAAAAYNRDFGNYYGQRSGQQGSLLERNYPSQTPEAESMKSSPGSTMSGYLKPGQTTPKSPGSSTTSGTPSSALKSPPSGNSGRGGRGPRGGRGSRGGGRGRGRGGGRAGRGRGGSPPSSGPSIPPILPAKLTKGGEVADDGARYYNGCVPLGLPEDKYWLSELQVYLRSNFAEAFGATEADIAAPMHGRNKPIALGQVGIRCMHCRNDPPSERGQQATSYPSLISGIYNSVQQMLRLHFDCCLSMPADVRHKIEQLKVSSSARGGRKQYWIDSAKRLGLIDTPHGIHFGRDPYGPLPPLSGPSAEDEAKLKSKHDVKESISKAKAAAKAVGDDSPKSKDQVDGDGNPADGAEASKDGNDTPAPTSMVPDIEPYPLVEPEDKDLISDYLYLTLEQMQPCNLMEADKVGCYKGRDVGFPGLACKHCVGQAGCGRYFPASEASLSQTTTSQTIMNHVRNCRRCPIEIRENLELMKRARMGPDGKRADKPKHGGRKVFFHRLWCRIQRLPISEDEKGSKKKRKKNETTSPRKNKKKRVSAPSPAETSLSDDDQAFKEGSEGSSDDDTETEDEESSEDEVKVRTRSRKGKGKKIASWHQGCVRLTKLDDVHWLSEIQCFVRSEMVEAFTHNRKDSLAGYEGRKQPGHGQVGIRCAFCKNRDDDERPQNCIYFPEGLADIQTIVNDLIRLHFPSCPSVPDDVKSNFRSMKGFGSKADSDSVEYWIDAARDVGLMEIPCQSAANNGWGLSFRRDPLQPSPADELDREKEGAATYQYTKWSLVRSADKESCTDHAMLLLRQVKPCRFKKTDRRGAPGARGRDRVIGFPGISCRHCSSKSSYGRYFPVSAKNLTDNTANSMQAHVSSCSRCPENIKASLAYLSHRSAVQKPHLSGSWKKSFYKKVWERLHVVREWDNGDEDEESASSSGGEDELAMAQKQNDGIEQDSEDEHIGENMSKLIKAAAIWLTEQDSAQDASRGRSGRGRALPSSRGRGLPAGSPVPPSSGTKTRDKGGSSKRRATRIVAV